ncbi:UvrB/UvrC motif-containing protein [Oscillospiraceae bacterium CM]|nr:UvrB/UvrC motif-containing protein [Oscillospiraceae bacterium CM]
MKCQNCGNEEVNFHYTSNINGNITEKHLCADCAEKLGLTQTSDIKPKGSLAELFTGVFGGLPDEAPVRYNVFFPTFVIPAMGLLLRPKTETAVPGVADEPAAENAPEIDEEMKKRRELNILREQLHNAVEAEDFEKAAALRDTIKQLENSENGQGG